MKTAKKTVGSLLTLIGAVGLCLNVNGCSKEWPTGPQKLIYNKRLPLRVRRKTRELKFLTSKPARFRQIMEARQHITAGDGGRIEVGNNVTGISSIDFNPGAVSKDVEVGFWWDSKNFQVEFTPHGITFNGRVRLRLSYKNADLTRINEDELGIWFYDEANDLWQLVGREVNKHDKYVEGTTTHFSRYAIAAE